MSSRSSSSVSKPASSANSSSSSGQLLGLDLAHGDRELRLLAGELRGLIVVGERDRDRALLAADRALELILEAGHEPAGAELDHLVAALAARERRAVDRAGEVHHHEVAALRLAVHGLELGRALAQAVDLVVDGAVGHRRVALGHLEVLVVAERRLRPHADLDRELQRLALGGQLAQIHLGIADRDDARVVDRGPIPAAERFAHRLVEHRLAADALDHDRRRRLAGAEARARGCCAPAPSPPG